MTLSTVQARALIAVVTDMAEDLALACTVVVVDAQGHLLAAERPAEAPGASVDRALALARGTVRGDAAAGDALGGASLTHDGRLLGAVAVCGGPDGFAGEAAHAAALALQLQV